MGVTARRLSRSASVGPRGSRRRPRAPRAEPQTRQHQQRRHAAGRGGRRLGRARRCRRLRPQRPELDPARGRSPRPAAALPLGRGGDLRRPRRRGRARALVDARHQAPPPRLRISGAPDPRRTCRFPPARHADRPFHQGWRRRSDVFGLRHPGHKRRLLLPAIEQDLLARSRLDSAPRITRLQRRRARGLRGRPAKAVPPFGSPDS